MMSTEEDKAQYFSIWDIFSRVMCFVTSKSSFMWTSKEIDTRIESNSTIKDPETSHSEAKDEEEFALVEARFIEREFDWRTVLRANHEIIILYQELFPTNHHQWVQITEIEPDIYLGGIPDPINDLLGHQNSDQSQAPHSFLSELDIKTIISFSDYEVWWNYKQDVSFTHFVMVDYEHELISEYFDVVIQRITEARKRGDKIFIHCHKGYSRSVTVLVAFYLSKGIPSNPKPTLRDAIKFIQNKRPFIRPNIGFFAQLVEFETRLRNKTKIEI